MFGFFYKFFNDLGGLFSLDAPLILGCLFFLFGMLIIKKLVASTLKSVSASSIENVSTEEKEESEKAINRMKYPLWISLITSAIYVMAIAEGKHDYIISGLEKILKICLETSLFLVLYFYVDGYVIRVLFPKLSLNSDAKELCIKIIRIILGSLGVITLLNNLNINLGPLIGGLTMITTAIALAAKDLLQGILGSLTVLIENHLKKGDRICVEEVDGFVEKIDMRTTSIRGFDRSLTIISNDALVSKKLTNFSKINNWEIKFKFALPHTTSVEKVEALLTKYREWLMKNPEVESPDKAFLVVNLFEWEDEYKIMVFFYTKTNDWLTHVKVRQDSLLALIRSIEELEISLIKPVHAILDKEEKKKD